MELATLEGVEVAGDLERSLYSVSEKLPEADRLHLKLAAEHNVHIVAGSGPAATDSRPVNRARLITPTGQVGVQDKQIMTRFEREEWGVIGGNALQVFETAIGKIGILICYDSEFPLLGRALTDCDVICVPSVTETLAGYWRVRIGSMARALENQCITAMSSVVGAADWSDALGQSFGAGGIFCPPDRGFPPTGILGLREVNAPGWTIAEADLEQVAEVRANGIVLNRRDWQDQIGREGTAINVAFR